MYVRMGCALGCIRDYKCSNIFAFMLNTLSHRMYFREFYSYAKIAKNKGIYSMAFLFD